MLNMIAVVMVFLWLISFVVGHTLWDLTYILLFIGSALLLMRLDSLRLRWLLKKYLKENPRPRPPDRAIDCHEKEYRL